MIGRRSRKDRSRQRRTRSRSDRAQTYTQRRRRRRRRIIICCGKTVNATRCHIVSFKTKFDEKLPFVQSSSRVFETKKKDRRDAPPEREPFSVLVLKSDDPQVRSRVLRRRLTQPMRCVCNYTTTTTTTTTTIQTYSSKKTREKNT